MGLSELRAMLPYTKACMGDSAYGENQGGAWQARGCIMRLREKSMDQIVGAHRDLIVQIYAKA